MIERDLLINLAQQAGFTREDHFAIAPMLERFAELVTDAAELNIADMLLVASMDGYQKGYDKGVKVGAAASLEPSNTHN